METTPTPTTNRIASFRVDRQSATVDLPFEHKLQLAPIWIRMIDFALLFIIFLLIFGSAKILYFHLIFIALTLGAFHWQFSAFVWRTTIAVGIVTTALLAFVFADAIPSGELIEIPLLTIILILVFAIAWQRTKAEEALRMANEDLEHRVLERTIDLSREIIEREKTERILRESEERYRQLIQLSFEAIVIHSEAEIIYLNPAGMKLLGVTNAKELVHKPFLDFIHPDSLAAIQVKLQQIKDSTKGAPLAEERFIRLDGAHIDVEIVTIPILYQGQGAMQTVIRDVTLRKQMEQARIAERVTIAHDLHDSLGQSLGYLHLKLDEIATYKPNHMTEIFSTELERMRVVAGNAYEQVRTMLASLMAGSAIHLAQALRAKGKVVNQLTALPIQVINRGQEIELPPVLQQQILSLCGEALTNIVKHANAQQIKVELWWTEQSLTITIEDDGCGFDPNVPHATTSYGLRIMQERAAQMEGILSIQSQHQKGTCLTLQVPLSTAPMMA